MRATIGETASGARSHELSKQLLSDTYELGRILPRNNLITGSDAIAPNENEIRVVEVPGEDSTPNRRDSSLLGLFEDLL